MDIEKKQPGLHIIKSILTVLFVIGFIFMLGETLVRLNGHLDEDGNFFVYQFQCYPYHIPVNSLKKIIKRYTKTNKSYLNYDPVLGWSPKPGSKSKNGLYFYDANGIRTASVKTIISKSPEKNILRIAIFGDSFTHGDDVPIENTWGYILENRLKNAGVNAQVLNFGVGGYGIDQSYLRWLKDGYKFEPQIVILGLQLENMNRDLNLARLFYFQGTGNPFFKPRFILIQNNLKLIDVPTPAPQKLIDIYSHFDAWEDSKYEDWYDKQAYRDNVFLKSKLIAFVYTFFEKSFDKKYIERYKYSRSLALAIISGFKKDVESRGHVFLVVFLPLESNMHAVGISFLDTINKAMGLIDPQNRFLDEEKKIGTKALFIPGHYSPKGHQIIADVLTKYLIEHHLTKPVEKIMKADQTY